MSEPAILTCSVCGKTQPIVADPNDLAHLSPKERRWMMLTFIERNPGDHGIICGGGLTEVDGTEHDRCLMRLIMQQGERSFRLFNHIEVFMPIEGLVPAGALP